MLLTIERVAILKNVDIFVTTPDYVLASVANIVEEVEFLAGEMIIREGDFEDSMYVVVDGKVRVHRDNKTLIELGPGATVGEIAVLDPEPRSADVTALTDTLLFRIDKEPFDEVMADRPEIAHGVIQALSRRIRDQGRYQSVAG